MPALPQEVEQPANEAASLRPVPIQSSIEEYSVYILALRCILRPLIDNAATPRHADETTLLKRLTFGLTDHLDELLRLSASPTVSRQQLRRMQVAATEAAARCQQAPTPDICLVRTLRKFATRTGIDADQLLGKGKDKLDDFRKLFSEILRLEARIRRRNCSTARSS